MSPLRVPQKLLRAKTGPSRRLSRALNPSLSLSLSRSRSPSPSPISTMRLRIPAPSRAKLRPVLRPVLSTSSLQVHLPQLPPPLAVSTTLLSAQQQARKWPAQHRRHRQARSTSSTAPVRSQQASLHRAQPLLLAGAFTTRPLPPQRMAPSHQAAAPRQKHRSTSQQWPALHLWRPVHPRARLTSLLPARRSQPLSQSRLLAGSPSFQKAQGNQPRQLRPLAVFRSLRNRSQLRRRGRHRQLLPLMMGTCSAACRWSTQRLQRPTPVPPVSLSYQTLTPRQVGR